MTIKFTHPFIIALLIYLSINGILLMVGQRLAFQRKSGLDKSAVAQACHSAVCQYQEKTSAPQIVLIGSSLMMSAVWSIDARKYANTADVYHYHQSKFLSDCLSQVGLPNIDVFSFGLPGAMVSDAYLIINKLFKNEKSPQIIVYGMAPRDFMDDLLTGETQTAVFRELSDLSDLWESGNLYLSSFNEKLDFALNNCFYLYGKRCRYQNNVQSLVNKLADKVFPDNLDAPKSTASNNELAFCSGSNKKETWEKSIKEYRARYKHFNESQFKKQIGFLQSLVKTCKERNIKIILVNLPLTADNLSLMPEGFYQEYLNEIKTISSKYQIELVDLHTDNKYSDNEFYDTVHLNADGGTYLLSDLSIQISKQKNSQLAYKTKTAL